MVTGSPNGSWPASHFELSTGPEPEHDDGTAMKARLPSVKMNPARQSTPPMLTVTPGWIVAVFADAHAGWPAPVVAWAPADSRHPATASDAATVARAQGLIPRISILSGTEGAAPDHCDPSHISPSLRGFPAERGWNAAPEPGGA